MRWPLTFIFSIAFSFGLGLFLAYEPSFSSLAILQSRPLSCLVVLDIEKRLNKVEGLSESNRRFVLDSLGKPCESASKIEVETKKGCENLISIWNNTRGLQAVEPHHQNLFRSSVCYSIQQIQCSQVCSYDGLALISSAR